MNLRKKLKNGLMSLIIAGSLTGGVSAQETQNKENYNLEKIATTEEITQVNTTNQPNDFTKFFDNVNFRFYSDNTIDSSGKKSSDNLGVLEYNDFGFGFERLDDATQLNYGIRVPIGDILGFDRKLKLYGLMNENKNGESQHEFIGQVYPIKDIDLDVVGRFIDLQREDGFSVAINYRQPGIFQEKSNFGAGIGFTDLDEDRTGVGGYAWMKIPQLHNLFIGAGFHPDKNSFVVGMPNNSGNLAWRYFRIDGNHGFQLNEFLFSTEGVNLKSIDFQSVLRGDADDAERGFTPHVFRYVVPPTSARGRGWTGGVLHIGTPDGKNFLDSELIRYFGDRFFVGGGYRGELSDYGEGQIIAPFGFRVSKEDDGLTRNFIRFTPYYDLKNNSLGLGITLEFKF